VSSQTAITLGRRQAGDSLEFHARYGRALQARAAREAVQLLFELVRSRRGAPPRHWRVEWPVTPRAAPGGDALR
jgi:hypothetical protein